MCALPGPWLAPSLVWCGRAVHLRAIWPAIFCERARARLPPAGAPSGGAPGKTNKRTAAGRPAQSAQDDRAAGLAAANCHRARETAEAGEPARGAPLALESPARNNARQHCVSGRLRLCKHRRRQLQITTARFDSI